MDTSNDRVTAEHNSSLRLIIDKIGNSRHINLFGEMLIVNCNTKYNIGYCPDFVIVEEQNGRIVVSDGCATIATSNDIDCLIDIILSCTE